jgi:hypothetical protein
MRAMAIVIAGCLAASPAAAQELTPSQGNEMLEEFADRARGVFAGMSFEEFKAATPYYPEAGKYVVNGDVPIRNEKLLKEFYDRNVANSPAPPGDGASPEFIILRLGGLDQIWNNALKRQLTYCVSHTFGARYPLVVADMAAAAAAWEAVADLDFTHLSGEDDRCDSNNNAVVFDVRPINVNGDFLAIAFFPNEPRSARNVFIDNSGFTLDPNGNLTLRGILRHELGHTIGARHEHTRPDSGACFEDEDWRGVTDYDAFSVMHYPQCNGQGDWTLRLTEKDKNGVACIYDAANGFVIDTSICTPEVAVNAETKVVFGPDAVAVGEMQSYGPFSVTPHTRFETKMTGHGGDPGDPDLYLKFDGPALRLDYDCRPFTIGADETCSVDVPAGKSVASVMVHGWRAGSYNLSVTHFAP